MLRIAVIAVFAALGAVVPSTTFAASSPGDQPFSVAISKVVYKAKGSMSGEEMKADCEASGGTFAWVTKDSPGEAACVFPPNCVWEPRSFDLGKFTITYVRVKCGPTIVRVYK